MMMTFLMKRSVCQGSTLNWTVLLLRTASSARHHRHGGYRCLSATTTTTTHQQQQQQQQKHQSVPLSFLGMAAMASCLAIQGISDRDPRNAWASDKRGSYVLGQFPWGIWVRFILPSTLDLFCQETGSFDPFSETISARGEMVDMIRSWLEWG